jgi:hypothetical protein
MGVPPAWRLGEGLTTSELAGSCEHGNENSGSIKVEEFLE